MEIFGPTDHRLGVECENNGACREMNIHAQNSSLLNLKCADIHSCCGIGIYCPVYTNLNDICRITGTSDVILCILSFEGESHKTYHIFSY